MRPFSSKLAFAVAAGSLALCAGAGQAQDRPTLRTDGTIVAMPPIGECACAAPPRKDGALAGRGEARGAGRGVMACFGYYRSETLPAEPVALSGREGRGD